MTILQAIEEANKAAAIRTLSFADLREFNSFMDSFTFEEYPVNVVVPFTINGTFDQSERTSDKILPLQGWVLTRISEDTNDYRSKELEGKYMEPMRKLAEKFMNELRSSDIVNSEVQTIQFTIRPEYQFLSAHVFGCSYTMNLPVTQRVC